MNPASLQLMHVAAHIDAIAGRIRPALDAGRWVILDRFWWSTWVYGLTGGADRKLLDAVIAVERAAWAGVTPAVAILVRRVAPLRTSEPLDFWTKLGPAYHELALKEEVHHPVVQLDNEGTVEDAVRRAVEAIDSVRFRVATRQPRKTRTPPRPGPARKPPTCSPCSRKRRKRTTRRAPRPVPRTRYL